MLERDAAPGIHRVEDAYTNWFIVEDGGALTIVDTGHPRSWRTLHSVLAELGRDKSEIAAIVQTHGHFDHVGFTRRAQRELGVPVYAPEGERHVVAHPWDYDHERPRAAYLRYPRFARIFAAMTLAGAPLVKGTEDIIPFGADRDPDVPGAPKVVPTPGHTYGHVALHFPDRDALIAGDAVVMLDPYTGRTGPRIVARAATADAATARQSLPLLAATGARTVLTGHGETWRQGAGLAAEMAEAAGVD